jgi:hypothetical protein
MENEYKILKGKYTSLLKKNENLMECIKHLKWEIKELTHLTPSSYVSMEHKAVFWTSVPVFKTSAENEGVSTTDMDACTTVLYTYWSSLLSLDQKCLVELLLSTLAKENWTLITAHAFGSNTNNNAYHFTRPVQTS